MRIQEHLSPEGALIRAFRVRANLTQPRVDERLGTAHGFLSQIERGVWRPSVHLISRICAALELSLAEEQQILVARRASWDGPLKSEPSSTLQINRPAQPARRDPLPVSSLFSDAPEAA